MYEPGFLKEKVAEFGFELIYVPEVDSTMRIIDEEARTNIKNRIIALTDHQTKGVGRVGRYWLDHPRSSIMFSVLMKIPQSSIASFADLVALAIVNGLQKATGLKDIKIKYPNDIVFADKKLGGILIRNIYDDKLKYLGTNIGIGVNIHYTEEMLKDFKTDYPATSLDICAGTRVSRQDLLVQIVQELRYLDTEIEAIEVNPSAREQFEMQWRNVSSMLGRRVSILKNDAVFATGMVVDTALGKGVELDTGKGKEWFSLFETDMKVRIVN